MLSSQLDQVQLTVDMLHTVVPEEDDLTSRDLLGPLDDQLGYIVKVSTELGISDGTYLLLYGSLRGLISSFLNQAK